MISHRQHYVKNSSEGFYSDFYGFETKGETEENRVAYNTLPSSGQSPYRRKLREKNVATKKFVRLFASIPVSPPTLPFS